ncbi:hypothetical protein EYC84_005875 [Monilinia fructicola]|uniref:Uncharacterized protein n=1 Tax=Monilinia fructicola TaxID=38448 RepID=A0A5M9K1W0_MONFR|nr:hypothetical protein EYC84_005875 [Monilinia fructicola]
MGLKTVSCTRMWGGDFVGDVNCMMLPGSAVRFEFRDREWRNCTNVNNLLRGDMRFVPHLYKPLMTAQVWLDSEWDGDSKLVDWRDTDWVTLAEKGLSIWRSQKQVQVFGDHHTDMRNRSRPHGDSQTHNHLLSERREMFSTQTYQHRPEGQMSLPLYNTTVDSYVGKIDDVIASRRQTNKLRGAAPDGQYMPPSLSSVRQPQFQRQSPISNKNLPTDAQAQQKRRWKAFEEAKAKANALAERKAQETVPSPSTFSVQTPPVLPEKPKIMPVWELARILKERERKESELPSTNSMKSLTDSVSSMVTRARDDNQSLQHANQTAKVGARVSVSQEVSSAHAHTSDQSQSYRLREQDEKRSRFLQNKYKQRLAMLSMRLDEAKEAGQPVQDDTHHADIHTSPNQGNSALINAPLFLPWNGVPAFVVPYEYNNTLPESDDRNFDFNNYSPTEQPTDEVELVASHDTTYSAPEHPLVVPFQAPSSVLKDWLTAPSHTSYAARGGPFLTPRMIRDVEIVEARFSNPDFNTIETLTETQRSAEKRVMIMIKEAEAQSKFHPVDQEEPMEDVLHIQGQTDALLQDSSPLRGSTEKLQKTEDQDQSKFQAIKQEDTMKGISAALQVQKKSDALIQESGHLQENPETKAMRELQRIEHESNIQGSGSMRDILHDQTQLDTFLQDFTSPQQEMVRKMWMVRRDKSDDEYSRLFTNTAAVSWGDSHRLQANNKIHHDPAGTDDKSGDEADERQHHSQNGNIHSGDQYSRRQLNFVLLHLRCNLSMKILLDQHRMNIFQQSYPTENQKMAREIWLAEVPTVSNDLRKSLNRMSRFGIKPGEESKIVGDDIAEDNQRDSEKNLMTKLNDKVQNMIRAGTRSMRPKQKINYVELEKQMALSNLINKLEPQLQPSSRDILSFYHNPVEVTKDQQQIISRPFADEGTDTQAPNIEAEIEAQESPKRDLHFLGSPSNITAAKQNSSEHKLQVENKEARKKRMTDLYYSGLISSIDAEDSGEEKLHLDGVDEDQNNRESQLENYNLLMVKDEDFDEEEFQAGYLNGNQEFLDLDCETNEKGFRKMQRKNRREMKEKKEQVAVPDSFHQAYSRILPKKPKETKASFRKRKTRAYMDSPEYKKLKSSSVNTVGNRTDMQKQVSGGGNLPEHGSGRQRRVRKKPCQKERLAKRNAGELEAHRQPMSNVDDYGNQGMVGELVATPHEVENQINSTMEVDAEQNMMIIEPLVNPTEAGYQMDSTSDELEKLVNYESDKDISMGMEIVSRPQSTGPIDSQKEVQSFIAASPAEAQHQNTAVEGSVRETVVDLTSGNDWDEPIDLTSD